MRKKTASIALLEQLASENRHVVSDWRALILLRRATFTIPAQDRRWEHLPNTTTDITPLFRQMRQRGEIRPFGKFRSLFQITVPYAIQDGVEEREVLFEMHPYAVLSHISAMVFHGLTLDQPRIMTATIAANTSGGLLPSGTSPSDWEGIQRPVGRRPAKIGRISVEWVRVKPDRFFGFEDYRPLGLPMRYTTLERTLIDGLHSPELCGGIENVLRSWLLARDIVDVDVLTYQVERFGTKILQQRAGYVLEQIGLSHPRLERWRATSQRGGSSRLAGAEPFSSTFDARWNLSLNAPVNVLQDGSP